MTRLHLVVLSVLMAAILGPPSAAQECANPRPDWIFCDDFEGQFLAQWQEVSDPTLKVKETVPASVFRGNSSLKLVFPPGDQNGSGWMHYWWNPTSGQNEVFLRWYVKYSQSFVYGGWDVKSSGLNGHRPGVRYGPGAGIRPDGTWFATKASSLGIHDGGGAMYANPREPIFYYYHLDQLDVWGDFGYQNQPDRVALDNNRWYCIEIRVKPNTVQASGQVLSDGEQEMWIDGKRVASYQGIRWRSDASVAINDLSVSGWVGTPTASQEQYRWEDNYVVSRSRIGCVATTDGPPSGPTNLRRTDRTP